MEIYTKEIPLFKSVFCGDVDREFEKETSLADYSPDISRLIKLDATPYVESAIINGDKCIINGVYLFSMLYESSESVSLSFATFNVPFTERIEIKTAVKEGTVNCKAKIKRIGCKIINPRKFSVRIKTALSLSVQGIERVKICDTSLLPQNVHVKKDNYTYKGKIDEKTNEFSFEESYNLNEKSVPVDDVIMNYFSAEKPECFLSNGKAELKTSVTSKLLYTGEGGDGKCIISKKSFPVSMTFDDTDIEDNVTVCCEASVVSAETSIDVDSYGENRVVHIRFTVKAKITQYKNCETEFATDGFASGCRNYPVSQKFTTLTTKDTVSRIFSLEGKFATDTKIGEIIDHTSKINECRLKKDDSAVILYGTYTVSLLCRSNERYENIDLTESFEEAIPETDSNFDIWDIDCSTLETSVNFSTDGKIEAKVVCSMKLTPDAYVSFSAVTDIIADDDEEKDGYNLIFCYPSGKDDLWNIAKRYFVNPDALRNDNPETFNAIGELTSRLPIIIKK